LGVVKGKNGEVGGGWRGEERAARSFVFVRKGEAPVPGANGGAKGNECSGEEDEDGLETEEQLDFEGWNENEETRSGR
jgi:25S rRNA (uracil2634-N3)-methyltransferase